MANVRHRYQCGDICPETAFYRIYKKTPGGLVPTEYLRLVRGSDPFPPTPARAHCYMWDAPRNHGLAA